VLLFSAISCILTYKNTAISCNEKNIAIINGGYIKNMTIVKTKSIENLSETSSLLKRRKNITNIQIGFVGPLMKAKVIAKNLSFEEFEKVKNTVNNL
jgi:uncharacterized membrane protein YdbT with pleckstrin-like domain